MNFHYLRFFFATIVFIYLPTKSLALQNPQVIRKSIGSQQQNIWSLVDQEFSEVRFDSNSDGQIDEWLLFKKNIKIKLFFNKNKLNSMSLSLKKSDTYILADYLLKDGSFILQASKVIKKPMAFTVNKMKSENFCLVKNSNDPFSKTDFNLIKNNLLDKQLTEKWSEATDSSCLSSKSSIDSALKEVFALDIASEKNKNHFAACLNSKLDTQSLILEFMDLTNTGPQKKTINKIICKTSKSEDCGKASLQTSSGIITLPISSPPCSDDMKSIYRKQIFHETLHSLSPDLPEERVEEIVNQCENYKFVDTIEKNTKLLADQASIGLTSRDNVLRTKSTQQATITQTAQLKVTNIPKEIAEGSVSIPSPSPQFASGIVALNNSFRETRSPATASVTPILQQSLAMSAPFFKVAARVFSNYKIEPASVNKTTTLDTTLAQNRPSQNSESNFQTQNPSSESQPKNSDQANERGIVKASNSEVGPSGSSSRGIASTAGGTISNSATSAAVSPPRRANDSAHDIERTQVAQNLVKMSIPQAMEYIKTNEENLERLKILVLTQKNKKWGYKDPSRAAVLIQEANGQLRIENQ